MTGTLGKGREAASAGPALKIDSTQLASMSCFVAFPTTLGGEQKRRLSNQSSDVNSYVAMRMMQGGLD